ncbi:MAG: recombinase family protein [Lachnospiraceae bacterium]|jgi:Site-specific recombinases, DNA invertase Pin homologs
MKNKKEKTVIGIYARKSKFTGKGESVDNQIKACEEYVRTNFVKNGEENINIEIYQDEGISGKDLVSRPGMMKLISDAEQGKIQAVICYRLDRVSRSVKDFSELVTRLSACGAGFISVNEAFDTRTPVGRAMMYIASVFAQLERETIAERITDNMYALAKTGRWLGGKTPLGFTSLKIEEMDGTGRKRSRYQLEAVEEELDMVRFIYCKYLELGSLARTETYLLNNNYHTRNGKYYGRYTIKSILSNPVYCVADGIIYKYLLENGYGVYSEKDMFDGSHGLTAYNKINCQPGSKRVNNVKDWIVAVGEHKGVINSQDWIKAQEILKRNSGKSYRYPKTTCALLSGIVRCGRCGSFMRPKSGRKTANGEKRYYYQCECKEKSKGNLCQMPNIPGNVLDKMTAAGIFSLKEKVVKDYSYLYKTIETFRKSLNSQPEDALILRQFKDCKRQAGTLIDVLARSSSKETSEIILERIDEITNTMAKLKEQYNKLQENTVDFSCGLNVMDLIYFKQEMWEKIPPAKQKDILKIIIKEIIWDGKNARIYLCPDDK